VIVRIVTMTVAMQRAHQINGALLEHVDRLREQPGLAYAKVGRHVVGDRESVIVVEEWSTPEDVWSWTAGDLTAALLPEEAANAIDSLSVDWYEAMDVDYAPASSSDLARQH
jgi:heme-degrading monooxygenase HmoA